MIHESAIKISIESKIVHLSPLAKAVRGACSSVIDDQELLYHLELCIVEAITNVINHAYHRDPNQMIDVIVQISDHEVNFKIVDNGDKIEMPEIQKELNLHTLNIAALPESGMGLFLIHKLMDEVHFSVEENKNVLTMKKRFSSNSN